MLDIINTLLLPSGPALFSKTDFNLSEILTPSFGWGSEAAHLLMYSYYKY